MASEPMSGVKVEAPNVKVEMPNRDATSHTISCDPSTLKDELLQAIEGIQIAGTFASSAIPGGRAELYKMLIYEKGAMFKAHTDTEKVPGMFGTLVISLPSTHQGGDVVLRHCGKQHVFRSSAHVQSCAFWYSDVSHEVLPVTFVYRSVLTYNLALDLALDPAQPRPSASLLG
ncbi:hypothetical protein FALCPG4_012201 [Fusarium falciforme]